MTSPSVWDNDNFYFFYSWSLKLFSRFVTVNNLFWLGFCCWKENSQLWKGSGKADRRCAAVRDNPVPAGSAGSGCRRRPYSDNCQSPPGRGPSPRNPPPPSPGSHSASEIEEDRKFPLSCHFQTSNLHRYNKGSKTTGLDMWPAWVGNVWSWAVKRNQMKRFSMYVMNN